MDCRLIWRVRDWSGAGGVRASLPRRQGPQRPAVSRSVALFLGSQHHLAGVAEALRQMEQCVEAALTVEQGRRLAMLFGHLTSFRLVGASGADVRFAVVPCPRFDGGSGSTMTRTFWLNH